MLFIHFVDYLGQAALMSCLCKQVCRHRHWWGNEEGRTETCGNWQVQPSWIVSLFVTFISFTILLCHVNWLSTHQKLTLISKSNLCEYFAGKTPDYAKQRVSHTRQDRLEFTSSTLHCIIWFLDSSWDRISNSFHGTLFGFSTHGKWLGLWTGGVQRPAQRWTDCSYKKECWSHHTINFYPLSCIQLISLKWCSIFGNCSTFYQVTRLGPSCTVCVCLRCKFWTYHVLWQIFSDRNCTSLQMSLILVFCGSLFRNDEEQPALEWMFGVIAWDWDIRAK